MNIGKLKELVLNQTNYTQVPWRACTCISNPQSLTMKIIYDIFVREDNAKSVGWPVLWIRCTVQQWFKRSKRKTKVRLTMHTEYQREGLFWYKHIIVFSCMLCHLPGPGQQGNRTKSPAFVHPSRNSQLSSFLKWCCTPIIIPAYFSCSNYLLIYLCCLVSYIRELFLRSSVSQRCGTSH